MWSFCLYHKEITSTLLSRYVYDGADVDSRKKTTLCFLKTTEFFLTFFNRFPKKVISRLFPVYLTLIKRPLA